MKKDYIRLVLIALGILAGGYLLIRFVLPLFMPFLLAGLIALLIEPLVRLLQNKLKMSRGVAVALSLVTLLGILGLILSLVLIKLVTELIDLSNRLPQLSGDVGNFVKTEVARAQDYYWSLPPDVLQFLERVTASLQDNISSIMGNLQKYTLAIVNSFSHFLAGVPSGIIFVVVTLIAVFFLSRDKGMVYDWGLKFIPSPWNRKIYNVGREIFTALVSFMRAQLILISITMVMTIVGLSIIGAKYALIMGLVIGFFDLLPVLGPSSIYVPWIIWEFADGHSGFGISLIVLYVVVMITRQILETKIVSESLGLHPLLTLASMYVGLKLAGIVGVIAGPLALIAIKAFAKSGIIGFRIK